MVLQEWFLHLSQFDVSVVASFNPQIQRKFDVSVVTSLNTHIQRTKPV